MRGTDWKKTPEPLVRFLDESMKGVKAERRTMFGYPCYFIGNNMCVGTFEDGLFLRLGVEGREKAMAAHRDVAFFEPRRGQRMAEYAVIPPRIRDDPVEFGRLLRASLAYVSSLPPKPKGKPRKRPA